MQCAQIREWQEAQKPMPYRINVLKPINVLNWLWDISIWLVEKNEPKELL